MTQSFDMTRFIAPFCRTCAFGACLAFAALAPALGAWLDRPADMKVSAGRLTLAVAGQVLPKVPVEGPAKIADRINAVWSVAGKDIQPALPVRPEKQQAVTFQIAGH